tara:strand:- start:1093 stop:1803 length:711 start_codon:yes stop_codon:yes gene_type:complete
MTSKVKLTRETIAVLKNFVDINQSIVFRKGNTIKTISNAENILAEYTCEEDFPQDFAIYDLAQFLMSLSLFDNPYLEFDSEDFVTIRDSRRSVRYYFSDPEITLKSAPDRNVNFPDPDLEFTISNQDMVSIRKASKDVLKVPDLTFECANGNIRLVVRDRENDTSNNYKQKVEGSCAEDLQLDLKVENLRLLDVEKAFADKEPNESYVFTTRVSKKLISEWTNERLNLKYYIALEP